MDAEYSAAFATRVLEATAGELEEIEVDELLGVLDEQLNQLAGSVGDEMAQNNQRNREGAARSDVAPESDISEIAG